MLQHFKVLLYLQIIPLYLIHYQFYHNYQSLNIIYYHYNNPIYPYNLFLLHEQIFILLQHHKVLFYLQLFLLYLFPNQLYHILILNLISHQYIHYKLPIHYIHIFRNILIVFRTLFHYHQYHCHSLLR